MPFSLIIPVPPNSAAKEIGDGAEIVCKKKDACVYAMLKQCKAHALYRDVVVHAAQFSSPRFQSNYINSNSGRGFQLRFVLASEVPRAQLPFWRRAGPRTPPKQTVPVPEWIGMENVP